MPLSESSGLEPNATTPLRVIAMVETTADAPTSTDFEAFFAAEYRSVTLELVIVAGRVAAAGDLAQTDEAYP
jgi:hypothetical protein